MKVAELGRQGERELSNHGEGGREGRVGGRRERKGERTHRGGTLARGRELLERLPSAHSKNKNPPLTYL